MVAAFLGGCGCPKQPPLQVVPSVDLERYQGLWYEIARYPNRFERGCVGATAEYTLKDDGTVRVINRCRTETLDGPLQEAKGKAWVVDPQTNARLKVRFFWPFTGDYWVLDLGDDYSYAVVGDPCRRYLWILAREPALEPALREAILERIAEQEYDPSHLVWPPQRAQPELMQGQPAAP